MNLRFRILRSFMRRLFTLRSLVRITAAAIALYCLLVVAENWTGARALAAARASLEQKGETLEFSKMIPKPIPDAQNFCAVEPLQGITRNDERIENTAKHEALRDLDWGHLWHKNRTLKSPPDLNKGCRLGQPFDFRNTAAFLKDVTYLATPVDATPAEVLAEIDRLHPLLKTLSDAALERTDAVLTPGVDTTHSGPPSAMPMPHFSAIQQAAKGLALRAQVAAAAGDAESAVRSIQASQMLTLALSQEPTLLSLLVSITTATFDLNSTWFLLRTRTASEVQLKRLLIGFERLDFLNASHHSLRGELAFQIGNIAWLKTQLDPIHETYCMMDSDFQEVESSWFISQLGKLIPGGWFDHNAANIIRLNTAYLVDPIKTRDFSHIIRRFGELNQVIGDHRNLTSPHHVFAVLSMPAYGMVSMQAIYSEAVRRQSIAAISVERFRLKHGGLPTTLTEAMPVVPLDPIDGQPMRYRQEGDSFTIWSIANDRKDDQGRLPTEKEAGRISRVEYTGDWVWKN